MSDLDAIGDEPALKRKGRGKRRPRGRLRLRAILAAAAMGLTALVVGVLSSDGSGPSPAETAAEIRRFVDAARTARYTLEDARLAPRIGGVVRFPDRSKSASLEGPYYWENITIGDAVYDRSAGEPGALTAQQWAYADAADLRGPPGHDRDFAALLDTTVVPLRTRPGRADLAGVFGALEDLRRVDADTVRGTLPLTALFTDPAMSEAMLDGTGSVTITVTSGPGGRLDKLIWELKARPFTFDEDLCTDDYPSRSCVRQRVTVQFSDWNAPVEIEAPPLSDVDLTPGIDEAAVASIPASVRLAPARVPADLLLAGISTPASEGDPAHCPGIRLHYSSEVAGGTSGSPRTLGVDIDQADCASPYDADPARPWRRGTTQGDVLREGTDDAAISWLIVVPHTTSRVTVEANLTEAELATVIDSIGPLDLATQPVRRSVPPQP